MDYLMNDRDNSMFRTEQVEDRVQVKLHWL